MFIFEEDAKWNEYSLMKIMLQSVANESQLSTLSVCIYVSLYVSEYVYMLVF